MTSPYVDTSALAKYYVNEPGSERFEAYIRAVPAALVSRLANVEFRCLVARRERAGTLSKSAAGSILAMFSGHVGQGLWMIRALEDSDLVVAADLIDRLAQHPLRTLDAIHLAVAQRAGASELATGDRTLATAAKAIGLKAIYFGR